MTRLQAHEGGMERTARRLVDSVARAMMFSSFAKVQDHRVLAPLHLLSTSESRDVTCICHASF